MMDIMEQRGINNVIILGVHTNMCVLGRPFGLRQLAKNGKNVVLMRDMTDTMYNPERAPYVTHFVGTMISTSWLRGNSTSRSTSARRRPSVATIVIL